MAVSAAAFRAEVGAASKAQVARAERAQAAAHEMVYRYARHAPAAVRDEAVIRCGAWLIHAMAGMDREREEGELQRTVHLPSGTSALRSSGAMALLSPWKRRRAV